MATATTTFLTIIAPSHTLGSDITLSASVTAADNSTPVGSIQFFDGNAQLTGQIPVDSSGSATFDSITFTRGTHNFTAKFSGAAPYANSTSPVESFCISYGINAQRVILNQQSPVQVLTVRPTRLSCAIGSDAAVMNSDSTSVITGGILLTNKASPIYLNNYDGEIWAMAPGPAHGYSLKGFGIEGPSLYFIEIYG